MTRKITPLEYSKLVRKSLTPADESVAGFCGRISDNAVAVPGKRNWIYVTLSKGGTVVEARNRFAPPAFGMAVILRPIRNNPLHYEIEDVRATSNADFDFVLLQNHAQNHDWRSPDETRVHIRQWRPLRVMPAAAGGVAIDIEAGRYETATGGSGNYAGVTSLSLSGYRPTRGAKWILIELDNTGALKYTLSAQIAALSMLKDSDIPARSADRIWLAAIKLYAGQSSIRDSVSNSDIVDLRLSATTSGGLTEAPIDATIYGRSNRAWVRLNEPDVFWPVYAFSRDVFEFDRVSPVGNKIGTSSSDYLTLNLTDTPVLQKFGGAQMYFWLKNPTNYKTIVKDRATATLISGAILINSISPIRSYHNAYIVALFVAPTTVLHTFSFRLAGGIKVWFDNTLVVDSWAPADETAERTLTYAASLTVGDAFLIRIEYYNVNIVPLLDCTVDAPGYANWTLGNAEGHYISSGNGTTQDSDIEPYYYLPAGDFAGKTVPLVMDLSDITTPTGTSITWEFKHGDSDFIPILHGDTILINGSDPFQWRYTLNSTFGDYTPTIASIAFDIAAHAPDAGVQSVVAGTNITVDNTDPANPVVSSTAGGGDMTKAIYDPTDSGSVVAADTVPPYQADLDEWHVTTTGMVVNFNRPAFFALDGNVAPGPTDGVLVVAPVSGARWTMIIYKSLADGPDKLNGSTVANKAALTAADLPNYGAWFPICAVKVEAGQTSFVASDIWRLTRSNAGMADKVYKVVPSVVDNVVTFYDTLGKQKDSGIPIASITPPTTTAENDFQVGGVAGTLGTWVTKTLAETKTILGTMPPAAHDQNASTIIIPTGMGTPTYDDVQDYLNLAQSSGRLTGGTLTAHAGPNGTLDISAMEGMIHTANTLGSPLIYFKKAAVASLALNDLAVNYIWITYTEPGGVPTLTYSANAARPAENTYNCFVIGRVWRSGNTVEAITTGQNIYDMYGRQQDRLLNKYGTMDRASGATIFAHSTPLRLSCDAGVWYFGNSRINTGAVDTFSVWYKTGGGAWTESGSLTLFSEVFDGGGGNKVFETYQNGTSLGTLTGNHYGVYWIFMCPEGDLYAVLGTSSYSNVGAAQAATIPASLPPYMTNWARLIGRVIIKKTAAAFYSVESVWATTFSLSANIDHASLSNLAYADAGHTGFAALAGLSTQTFDVAAATAIAMAPRADQIQINSLGAYTTGGTSTAFTFSTLATPIALTTNERWTITFNATAGATPTLNRDAKGAKALKYYNSAGAKTACGATTIISGMIADVVYDGTDYVVMLPLFYSHPNHSGDVTSVGDGATTIGAGKVTLAMQANMATASVVYRKTAGAGAPEVNTIATLMADMLIESGTYTPALTNVTNVAASTAAVCQYMRIGNVVTVSGGVTIDPTTTGATELGMSLPIASNLVIAAACGGTFCNAVNASNVGSVNADTVNDRAKFSMSAIDVNNRQYAFVFQYLIV